MTAVVVASNFDIQSQNQSSSHLSSVNPILLRKIHVYSHIEKHTAKMSHSKYSQNLTSGNDNKRKFVIPL